MTAIGTAKLLALLATDRALTPADSATVRRRMRRDPKRAAAPRARASPAARRASPGSRSTPRAAPGARSTPTPASCATRRAAQFVLVVFTEGNPPYRGEFIAELTYRAAAHLLNGLRPQMNTDTTDEHRELDSRLCILTAITAEALSE